MFCLSALPKISFVRANSEQTVDLSQCGGDIQEVADIVSQLPASCRIGLIFRTGPELIVSWLGVLAAGRVPLVLQYPTEKINKVYWQNSVTDTVSKCGLAALLCAPELSAYAVEKLAPCVFIGAFEPSNSSVIPNFPSEGEILQLSSGTTGFKKPLKFSFEALRQHTSLYNQMLRLRPHDCVVSWLPLYHDMGFIACFIMPLLLKVHTVFIDPIQWVHEPQLLFDAIKQHNGTVCFMPNFGFEVMAKLGKSGPFPTMRHWISCSEPTYAETLEKFIKTTGTDPETVSTCYGMAENVFAVAQSVGFQTIDRDGRRYVSCGAPIPRTEVTVKNGELFVRSPYSVAAYEGDIDIRDAEGFYPTGDVGFIESGQVVITGRKQDIANIGGRKFLLSDLDFTIGRLFPASAGRIASMAVYDRGLGTEKALILIEDDCFWEKEDAPDLSRAIRETVGMEWLEVHFVPAQFITKTSSGKINRKKTLEDWLTRKAGVRLSKSASAETDFAQELRNQFPGVSFSRPVQEELDSLGQIVLRLFCEEHEIDYAPDLTLECIATARIASARETSQGEVFSIVALVDGSRLGFGAPKPFIDDDFLSAISAAAGAPVRFEHICVPPAPILFSDLIFYDYFLSRNPDPAYNTVSSLISKIKQASLILVDDEDNFRVPPFCVYPELDHRFTMHPDAELLGHRLQRYTQNHHLLPRHIVLGRDVDPGRINPAINNLENYLGTPVFRMAFHEAFQAFTQEWQFTDYRQFVSDAEKISNISWLVRFRDSLASFIRRHADKFKKTEGEPRNSFVLKDTPHFCSFLLNPQAVEYVALRYDSFCILGLPSSLPFLQRRLEELGKPYFFSTEGTPTRDDYECLIVTGGAGRLPPTNKPTFDFVYAREEGQGGGRPHNVPPAAELLCPPLAQCNRELFTALRAQCEGSIGNYVFIGNYLLNATLSLPDNAPAEALNCS